MLLALLLWSILLVNQSLKKVTFVVVSDHLKTADTRKGGGEAISNEGYRLAHPLHGHKSQQTVAIITYRPNNHGQSNR